MSIRYLLDSNVFINPHRTYFPVSTADRFWAQMAKAISRKDVGVLDVVYNEVCRSEDDLSDWLKNVKNCNKISVKNLQYIDNYRKVLDYIQNSGYYKDQALREWAADGYADPWLIAAAVSTGATIVTMETKTGGLTLSNPSKRAKIPDVCVYFNVRCETIFDFIKEMKFQL